MSPPSGRLPSMISLWWPLIAFLTLIVDQPLSSSHQCIHHDKGSTIHSTGQLHAFGTQLHQVPRSQDVVSKRIITSEGFHIPLSYHSGLPYMDMCPPTDAEVHSLPHILLTSNVVHVILLALMMSSPAMGFPWCTFWSDCLGPQHPHHWLWGVHGKAYWWHWYCPEPVSPGTSYQLH